MPSVEESRPSAPCFRGGPPLGYALSGGVAAIFGAQLALVIGAISCAVVAVGIGASHRKLRDPNLGAFEERHG